MNAQKVIDAYAKGERNFRYENLRGAYLNRAYLNRANLYCAYLRDANLRDANLRDADLRGADFRGADLRGANLSGAYLRDADLYCANLRGAYLPSPPMMLSSNWGLCMLPDTLRADLMVYDAACHPDPGAFTEWAAGGGCPYDDVKIGRAAMFREERRLWDPSRPLRRPYDLMVDVIRAYCKDSDFHISS